MIRADLHIHSCLSPCGSLDMGPRAIIAQARKAGLTHIALTDHNSTRNVPAFVAVAEQEGVICFPGIEVTTEEEAHVLCYFNTLSEALQFGSYIEESLLPIPLDPDKMGDQIVVNSAEEILELPDNYLNVSSSYSISALVDLAKRFNAFIVPAHVDKPLFSIISQLGFLPAEPFDGVEISAGALRAGKAMPYGSMPTLSASDSHFLDAVGQVYVEIETNEVAETVSDLFALLKRCPFTLVQA